MTPLRGAVLGFLLAAGPAAADPLRVPAFTAYTHPDPEAPMSRGRGGRLERWTSAKDQVVWYGRLAQAGRLDVSLDLALPEGTKSAGLMISFRQQGGDAKELAGLRAEIRQPGVSVVSLGTCEIPAPGYYKFTLSAGDKIGDAFPTLTALMLDGPAAKDAHFSTVERRNAASVHLNYPVPDDSRDKVEWFYCEVTPKTDPLWTYYEACGWHRGYFGMQVNSPNERRLIFSVWDSGREGVDRTKVAAEDRVTLLGKGEGVVASDFGNEGTGGHSHLVYPWKLGGTFRFLLHAEPDGTHTTYTGWFYFPETKKWGLIASFRAPRDGRHPHGLYSFNENFGGANGDERRLCEFGNQWVRTTDGKWFRLTTARFTHDDHGDKQRLDRSAGLSGDNFYLSNGGFLDDPAPGAVTKAGEKLERPPGSDQPPADAELPARPKPPQTEDK